jgi:hypothetical protein
MRLHRTMIMRAGGLAGAVLAQAAWTPTAWTPSAWAQGAAPMRIRGTIEAVTEHSFKVKERNGATENIVLDDPLTVRTVRKLALSDIAKGSFVGIASKRLADGSLEALEVLVFPESMRGAGEGHRPWDLQPDSLMTNAAVDGVVESSGGRELTLKYKDGSQHIKVPPSAPVVTFEPAQRADLKAGAPVFLSATRNAQQELHANSVTVGTNGVAPPM